MNYILYIFVFLIFQAPLVFADTPPAAVQVPSASDAAAADTQTSYLYDLKKLIDKSRQNIKEVNQKIKEQAVLKRNQMREERAREYYEKGVELTNEGKLTEAREYFEKAIRITEHPEMAGYIRESQRRLRMQENALHAQESAHYKQIKEDENTRRQEVEEAYRQAVELYKQKKYHEAKDAFGHVDELAPDYRATASYLKIIDQDMILADAQAAKQQAAEIARQQKEAEAARAKEKAMWLQQVDEKEKERKEAINRQAGEVYEEAVRLYKQKQFAAAKKKFEEVSWVIPDYQATRWYLARIDKDAQEEQIRVEREKEKALQQQRWEEEVQRKKLEARRQRDLEAKRLQHQKDLEEQAGFLYTGAVKLYGQKNMDKALGEFNDIEKLYPDFKSTRTYIARIKQWQSDQQQLASRAQQRQEQAHKQQPLQGASSQQQPVPQTQPASIAVPAAAAVASSAIAGPKGPRFNSSGVNSAIPQQIAPPPSPSMANQAGSLDDLEKQFQEITDLAQKSRQLYQQVADIADDQETVQTKRKMAQMDHALVRLKENEEHALRRMQEEQWEQQQKESRLKEEQRKAQAEKMYTEAMESFRSQNYKDAKIKFLALDTFRPDYKSTRRYLKQIDEDLQQQAAEAVTTNEKAEARHLQALQEKQNIALVRKARQEEDKQRQLELARQASLKELAEKASGLNDEIIRLTREQNYPALKEKFTELETTVTALTTLKDQMAKDKGLKERQEQLARESVRRRNEMLKAQKQEDRQIHSYYGAKPLKEYRPVLSEQTAGPEDYKRQDIAGEQNMLFNEAVDRYEHGKYTQAKLLFGELAEQNDRRADAWLRKVDRAISREELRSRVGEEKERTAFIADQLKAERQLAAIQERERRRQKKLTEELERQTRAYEDDRLRQLRKEMLVKAQEHEREVQEQKRLEKQQELERQQEALRFRKIVPSAHQPPPAQAQPKASAVPAAASLPAQAPAKPAGPRPPSLTPQQLKAQIEYSNKRKAYLDRKYRQEQAEKARQEKIKAAQEARQKQEEERQAKIKAEEEARQARTKAQQEARQARTKAQQEARQARIKAREDARKKREEERQKEIQQREQERQAKVKAQEDARQAKIKAEQEARRKMEEEQQKEMARQEELRAQQEQERAQKAQLLAQQKAAEREARRKKEQERQESEREAQLQAQRDAVRKELEDGVETMYQEALNLYKQGQYTAAAERFKDVEDILPGYKKASQYMDDSRAKAMSAPPVESPAVQSPAVSRQDDVSKALDLFDPDAK